MNAASPTTVVIPNRFMGVRVENNGERKIMIASPDMHTRAIVRPGAVWQQTDWTDWLVLIVALTVVLAWKVAHGR